MIRLSVLVPTFNSSSTLSTCLEALVRDACVEDEIIVADDGSDDGELEGVGPLTTGRVTVVRSGHNIGRGPIRNLAAAKAGGDILVFVDADVVVTPGTLDRIRTWFAIDDDRTAMIGSYDDRPASPGVISQYRNLLHHHTHQTHGPTATHFWTGLGAIRRGVFEELGGLDEQRWARDMEDVEFGHRVVDAGYRIDVLPDVQGTHLKRFTLCTMLRTDLFNRAIPWSTLMLDDHLRTDEFVVSSRQRISAVSAAVVILAAVPGPSRRTRRLAAAVAIPAFLGSNRSLWVFLAHRRGVAFAAACVPLHLMHSLTSVMGFATALARLGAGRLRPQR